VGIGIDHCGGIRRVAAAACLVLHRPMIRRQCAQHGCGARLQDAGGFIARQGWARSLYQRQCHARGNIRTSPPQRKAVCSLPYRHAVLPPRSISIRNTVTVLHCAVRCTQIQQISKSLNFRVRPELTSLRDPP